jgi:hypothetical protein
VKRILVFYLLVIISFSTFAQLGGKKSYEFLNVPNNARLAALGGVNVSLANRDVNFFYNNPSLVSDSLKDWASISYQFYVAGVHQTTASYVANFKKIGFLNMGIQHLSYGIVKSYDATGAEIGDFNSGETAIVIGKSHQVNNFRIGVNAKMAFSSIAGYRSSAMLLDIGGLFVHPNKKLFIGLAMKNLGVVLSEYSETSKTKLPVDIQLGITFKPEHMPFRFSITGYNLMQSNITYYDVQNSTEKPGTFDKILRRFNFATEILIHRNVNVMIGYNYRLHQELKLENGGAGAGISFGFSATVKSTEFTFSRSGYMAGKAGYTFTVSLNVQKLLMRR